MSDDEVSGTTLEELLLVTGQALGHVTGQAAKVRELIGDDAYNIVRKLGLLDQVESDLLPCTMEPPDPSILMAADFVETEIIITLDSGCCEHVMDLADAMGYQDHLTPSPGSRNRQHFVVGNGQRIPNEGQVQLNMETLGGAPVNLQSVFQVAEVKRPLMSVSRICESGYTCSFDKDEARITTKAGAHVMTFTREGGLYVAKLKLKSPKPFGRQDA